MKRLLFFIIFIMGTEIYEIKAEGKKEEMQTLYSQPFTPLPVPWVGTTFFTIRTPALHREEDHEPEDDEHEEEDEELIEIEEDDDDSEEGDEGSDDTDEPIL